VPLAGCGSWSLDLISFLFGWCKKPLNQTLVSTHCFNKLVVICACHFVYVTCVCIWLCLPMLANWLVGTIVTEMTYNVLSRIRPYSFYLSIYLFVLGEQQARWFRRYRLVSKMICYIRSAALNSITCFSLYSCL